METKKVNQKVVDEIHQLVQEVGLFPIREKPKQVKHITQEYINSLSEILDSDQYTIHIKIEPKETEKHEPSAYLHINEIKPWNLKESNNLFQYKNVSGKIGYLYNGGLAMTVK